MKSIKLEHIVTKLTRQYLPFNSLSRERCAEAINLLRIIELRQGDRIQLGPRPADHCLLVIEGLVSLAGLEGASGLIRVPPAPRYPVVVPVAVKDVRISAQQDATLCLVDRQLLDDMLSWEVMSNVVEQTNPELGQQLDHIRNCRVFRRLPFECVEAAFKHMREIDVPAGRTVIEQGDVADAYYILKNGTADVYFKEIFEDEPELIAQLKHGDAFGSEALISGRTRNETVRMTSDGTLMVLSKTAFDELIRKSLVRTVNHEVAQAMVKSGYRLLDVRSEEEYDEAHIPDALPIPLNELRGRIGELDAGHRYIAYCHSGSRSAVAALLLAEYQIEVYSMDGGIRNWPYRKESEFAQLAAGE